MLIVETGAGVAGANTYADVATVEAYCVAHGHTAWTNTLDAALKAAAIMRAMTYIEALSWNGYKAQAANPLEWPRSCMTDRSGYTIGSNVVPGQVVQALCEAAIRELAAAGATMPDTTRDDGMTSLEVAGAVKMAWASSAQAIPDFRIIKAALKGLVAPTGGVRLLL